MAQYWWTAEDYAVGATPSDSWENITSVSSSIEEDGSGRKRLRIDAGTGRSFLKFTPPGDLSGPDTQVWMKWLQGGTNDETIGAVVRARDVGTSLEEFISARDSNETDSIRFLEWVSGSVSEVASVFPDPPDLQINESRFQVFGTDAKYRWWEEANAEPSVWDVEASVSVTQSGAVGVENTRATNSLLVYEFGVGTDGDPAPTGPVSADPTTPTNLTTTDITANSFRAGWTP